MRETGATWLVPDGMRNAGEPRQAFPHWGSEFIVVGDELHYVLRMPTDKGVWAAWNDAVSAAGMLGVLTTAQVPRACGTDRDITNVANNSIVIAASGYDLSSHLIFFERRP